MTDRSDELMKRSPLELTLIIMQLERELKLAQVELSESGHTGHAAVQAVCVHKCLDDRHVPRADANGEVYSLWGRVQQYVVSVGQDSPTAQKPNGQ